MPDPKLLQTAIDAIEHWHDTYRRRRQNGGDASLGDLILARTGAKRALKRAADAGHDVAELRELNNL